MGPNRALARACWRSISGASSTACRPSPGDDRRRARPRAIVNTGSKQGITTPPGDTAYNVSKAGVKMLTEALAHELRNVARLQGERPPAGAGLHLHRHDRGRGGEKAAGRLDARAGHRLHARAHGQGRLLHPLPGQRRHPRDGRSGASSGRRATSSRTGPALSRWHPDYKEAFAQSSRSSRLKPGLFAAISGLVSRGQRANDFAKACAVAAPQSVEKNLERAGDDLRRREEFE